MINDTPRKTVSGMFMLFMLLLLIPLDIAVLVFSSVAGFVRGIIVCALLIPFLSLLLFGLFMVNPNESRVSQLFGRYVGTTTDGGLRWINPFYSKKSVSLRVNNLETDRSKVNDADGNPIEIAAVVV